MFFDILSVANSSAPREGKTRLLPFTQKGGGGNSWGAAEQPFYLPSGIVPEPTENLLPLVPSAGLRFEF